MRYRLSREPVDAPSLEEFKASLDGVLSTLVYWKLFLLWAEQLELNDL